MDRRRQPAVIDLTDQAALAVDASWLVPGVVLSLVCERADHGYSVTARARALGIESVERTVYRALELHAAAGRVEAVWDKPKAGPARKVYRITDDGRRALEGWINDTRSVAAHARTQANRAGRHLRKAEGQ